MFKMCLRVGPNCRSGLGLRKMFAIEFCILSTASKPICGHFGRGFDGGGE